MILVDYSALVVAAACVQKKDTIDEGLLHHISLNCILSAKRRFSKTYGELYLCCDDRHYWRKDVFPNYKAHRKTSKEDSTFDWNHFFTCMEKIKLEIKTVFPYRVLQVPKAEADDIIGTLALEAKEPTVIYSGDHDFFHLMKNPFVKLWLTNQKKLYKDETLEEIEFELHRKIMKGDSGDGIPNVLSDINSFVTKTRQTSCRETFIEEVWSKGPASFNITERYFENQKLIDLSYTPENIKQKIRDAAALPPEGSKGRIFNYLTNRELNKLGTLFVKDLGDF